MFRYTPLSSCSYRAKFMVSISKKYPFTFHEFLDKYIQLNYTELIKHFDSKETLKTFLEDFAKETGCVVPWSCYSKEDLFDILDVVYADKPFDKVAVLSSLEKDVEEVQETFYRVLKQDRKVEIDQSEVKGWIEDYSSRRS